MEIFLEVLLSEEISGETFADEHSDKVCWKNVVGISGQQTVD